MRITDSELEAFAETIEDGGEGLSTMTKAVVQLVLELQDAREALREIKDLHLHAIDCPVMGDHNPTSLDDCDCTYKVAVRALGFDV